MYYLYPCYHFPVYRQTPPPIFYHSYSPVRDYPPVDTTTFSQSVKAFKILLKQGELLIDKFADTDFSYKVMDAAQKGDKTEVDRLVASITGLTDPVKVNYTPSGVQLDITAPHEQKGGDCCALGITLKWRA